METSFILLVIVQIILIFVLAILLYIFLRQSFSVDLEKRFSNYSLTSSIDEKTPLFERLFECFWKLIRKINNIVIKSEVLKKYATHFEKYISFDEKNKKTGIDFVSIKFLISIMIGLIYIISSLISLSFKYMFLLLIVFSNFFIVDILFIIEYKSRKKRIENDLLNAIIIMNNAFKSGMNIMQSVSIVENELEGPIKDEFKKISMDIKYGLSLEVVFDRFYNRIRIEDAKYITSSLSLINKTGGNIVRVFGSIERNFYDKKKIKDEMNSLTSSSIFMFRMLVIMPLILCIIIYILNSTYFEVLIFTSIGRIILLLILLLYILYIIVVKKIMKVEV